MYFIIRATPIDDINDKSHKTELKSSINYSTNHMKSNSCHLLFIALGAYTHTHTFVHESDFKKPGTLACGRHAPGLKYSLEMKPE